MQVVGGYKGKSLKNSSTHYFHPGLHLGRIIADSGGGSIQPHGQTTRDNNDTRISKEAAGDKEVVLRETADSDETEDHPKVSMFVVTPSFAPPDTHFVRHNLLTSPPLVTGTGSDT